MNYMNSEMNLDLIRSACAGIFTETQLSYIHGSDRIERFLKEGFEITSAEDRELMFPTTCYIGRKTMKVLFFQKGDEKRTAVVHMDQVNVFSKPLSFYERFTKEISSRADFFCSFFNGKGIVVGQTAEARRNIECLMQIRCFVKKEEVVLNVPICCDYAADLLFEAKKEGLGRRLFLNHRFYVCGMGRQVEALWDCFENVADIPGEMPYIHDSLVSLLEIRPKWPATYVAVLVDVLLHIAHAMEVKEGTDDGRDRIMF